MSCLLTYERQREYAGESRINKGQGGGVHVVTCRHTLRPQPPYPTIRKLTVGVLLLHSHIRLESYMCWAYGTYTSACAKAENNKTRR